jgi:23S rRNA pseudouridine1911/1915/1917 synthase
VAKPDFIELGNGEHIPILYEDRSVLAIDKPAGWMLVPFSWQQTKRNLQAAIASSIAAGGFWARSRQLKFVHYVHRLDAETTGVLLFSKSKGAVDAFGSLFEDRRMEKTYLAVVDGVPTKSEWSCRAKLGPDPKQTGRMRVDQRSGKEAETFFKVLKAQGERALISVRPVTGRTHQIRVHLLESGFPIVGDELYGREKPIRSRGPSPPFPIGLRAVLLAFTNPFTKKRVRIQAPVEAFLKAFGFTPADAVENRSATSEEVAKSAN